jgi:hypothetical protein
VFKKAFFLVLAVVNRFSKSQGGLGVPLPDIARLPVMSDNVLPSLLVYLGVIKLEACTIGSLAKAFPSADREKLLSPRSVDTKQPDEASFQEGPVVPAFEAYVLRAAAIDACEKIVGATRSLGETFPDWLSQMTRSQLDMWLWSVAKDRIDYRLLPRFAERGTPFY